MKVPYPGQLLTAISVDPNNRIYPLAYGLVETEKTESWIWFLTQLGDDLDLYRNSNFTFISDRQKVVYIIFSCLSFHQLHIFFNRKLVGGRDKPIIATLEFAKEYLMKRCDRPCTPTATKILKENLDEAKKYSVDWDGDEF
nr:hypothetical protein [Tanacetum cinerariifolium]